MKTDPSREIAEEAEASGIYVRAVKDGRWQSVDIVELDAVSLLDWLRSRGGKNTFAEDVVGIMLGHGPLNEVE